ncbi:MAG: D-alanyl-D-alanine carboxypeptidase family protein [Paracoccaceae bacterium]
MDARTGETLYSENADTRLHPASLTKMMTLYIAFQEIEEGRLSLDSMITVSKNAAAQPPSRLGLKAGQKIQLRYLIRAAAIKSANDAASAIGDHIGGNQEKFANRMTRTARSLGMASTSFKNANGLTAKGHLSTAHDMSILGRRLFYDFPQYYNIFSRRSTDAGLATVANTNRKFLDAYPGADGIKTGYTDAAGFNLTASAERGGVRIIATVFGGSSTPNRNAKMADLLDIGFRKAPNDAPVTVPNAPVAAADEELIAEADLIEEEEEGGMPAKVIRLQLAVKTSPRPLPRPVVAAVTDEAVAAMQDGIAGALAEAIAAPPPEGTLEAQALEIAAAETAPEGLSVKASPALKPVLLSSVPRPPKRNAPIFDSAKEVVVAEVTPEVVTRKSTSGGRHWGVSLGRYGSKSEAHKLLMKVQLAESATLGEALPKTIQKSGGFDANFMGLSQEQADLVCRKLAARAVSCFTMGP